MAAHCDDCTIRNDDQVREFAEQIVKGSAELSSGFLQQRIATMLAAPSHPSFPLHAVHVLPH